MAPVSTLYQSFFLFASIQFLLFKGVPCKPVDSPGLIGSPKPTEFGNKIHPVPGRRNTVPLNSLTFGHSELDKNNHYQNDVKEKLLTQTKLSTAKSSNFSHGKRGLDSLTSTDSAIGSPYKSYRNKYSLVPRNITKRSTLTPLNMLTQKYSQLFSTISTDSKLQPPKKHIFSEFNPKTSFLSPSSSAGTSKNEHKSPLSDNLRSHEVSVLPNNLPVLTNEEIIQAVYKRIHNSSTRDYASNQDTPASSDDGGITFNLLQRDPGGQKLSFLSFPGQLFSNINNLVQPLNMQNRFDKTKNSNFDRKPEFRLEEKDIIWLVTTKKPETQSSKKKTSSQTISPMTTSMLKESSRIQFLKPFELIRKTDSNRQSVDEGTSTSAEAHEESSTHIKNLSTLLANNVMSLEEIFPQHFGPNSEASYSKNTSKPSEAIDFDDYFDYIRNMYSEGYNFSQTSPFDKKTAISNESSQNLPLMRFPANAVQQAMESLFGGNGSEKTSGSEYAHDVLVNFSEPFDISKQLLTPINGKEPYMAFNIWTYDEGQLKLTDVKKIPARDILGPLFYKNFTDDEGESLLVLADSLLITDNVTKLSENLFGNEDKESIEEVAITIELTETLTKPTTTNDDATTLHDLDTEDSVTPATDYDDQLIMSTEYFDENQDFTFLIDTSFENDPLLDYEYPSVEGDILKYLSTINNHSKKHEFFETLGPTFSSILEKDNVTVEENQESLEVNSDLSDKELETGRNPPQNVVTPPPSTILTSNQLPNLLTKNGTNIQSTKDGDLQSSEEEVSLDGTMESEGLHSVLGFSKVPTKIQVSLINDEGIPVNQTALLEANLVSIISNKPTVVNHNVYHIQVNDSSFTKQQVSAITEGVVISNSETEDINIQPTSFTPSMEQENALEILENGTLPEEELLISLMEVPSFNSFMDMSVPPPVAELNEVNSLVIQGMVEANPDLVSQIRDEDVVGSLLHSESPSMVPRFPVEKSSVNESTEVDFENNSEIMEYLIRNNKLPREIEQSILSDVLSGLPISDAIQKNIEKHRDIIDEKILSVILGAQDNEETSLLSPLTVIESLEKDTNSASIISSSVYDENSTTVDADPLPPKSAITRLNFNNNNAGGNFNIRISSCLADKTCMYALAIALAAGTTGMLSVPLFAGRSLKSSIERVKYKSPSHLMSKEDAEKIMKALVKYASMRNNQRSSKENLVQYFKPYINYLAHVGFPDIFGTV